MKWLALDIGGANLKATDEAVTQVLTRFAPKGLMGRIQEAGYNWDGIPTGFDIFVCRYPRARRG